MWLLDTATYQLQKHDETTAPEYAILSHTWTSEELSHQDLQNSGTGVQDRAGYHKLQNFCQISANLGYKHAWIDTVCIDKTSSAELAEAINSMFRYYLNSSVCIIYLTDVTSTHPDVRSKLENSRWFTRGFTLQELIAGRDRRFYAVDWTQITNDMVGEDLIQICSKVSGVKKRALQDPDEIDKFCVAERMSWAANRETTRPEDRAYSLMGIFGISMPILYGEGEAKAFYRLQKEIMKTSFDQTLFAWRGPYPSSGLLAGSPADFAHTPELGLWDTSMLAPHYFTNIGLAIRLCLYLGNTTLGPDVMKSALQCDVKTATGWKILCIRVQRIPDAHCYVNGEPLTAWRRVDCHSWDLLPSASLTDERSLYEDAVVLEDEHLRLVERSWAEDLMRKMEEFWGTEEETLSLSF